MNVAEARELDAVLPRECGVSDIAQNELGRVTNTVRHVVYKELGETVTAIYVMGSFARGEARRVASDLDIRVVVNGVPDEQDREACEAALKNDYGPSIVPDAAGYIDAHVTPMRPLDDEAHIRVFPPGGGR